jgi:predicted dinucleotide-binding enzyme
LNPWFDPARVPGDHVIFLSHDDQAAKRQATELLGEFGWPEDRLIDLGGDITTARGPETIKKLRPGGDA